MCELCGTGKKESRILKRERNYGTIVSNMAQLPAKRLVEVGDAPTKRIGRTKYDDFQGWGVETVKLTVPHSRTIIGSGPVQSITEEGFILPGPPSITKSTSFPKRL